MDQEAKKTVLRRIVYGLYAFGVRDGEAPHLMTVNWVTQVAFEPPMIAVAVERESRSLPLVRRTRAFALSVFPTGARQLAGTLGRSSAKVPDKLAGIPTRPAPITGAPILEECTGWLDCRVTGEMETGDHILVIAEVVEAGIEGDAETLTLKETGFRYAG